MENIKLSYLSALGFWKAKYSDWKIGDPVGRGWTEREAIANLEEELWDVIAEPHVVPQYGGPRLVVNNGVTEY